MNCELQILKTYFNRPIYLLVYLIAFGVCLALAYNATTQDHQFPAAPEFTSPRPILLANSQNFLQKWDEPSANKCRTLDFRTFEPDTVPDLSSLPKLTTLRISTETLSEQDLQRILDAPKLKSLQLNVATLADGTLARLGSKLVELQITSQLLDQHHKELSQLSQLKTMILGISSVTTAETFQAIATIPNLRTLSIVQDPLLGLPRNSPFAEGIDLDVGELTKEMIQPLLGHPTLRGVFSYWPQSFLEDPQLLRELHAYPATYSQRIKMSLSLMTLITILFVVTFQQHQAKLLLLSQSSLAPGFDSANRIVLGSLLATITLISATLLTLNGVNCFAAVAMALWIPVLIASFLILSSFSLFWKSPLSRVGLILMGAIFFNFQMVQAFLPSHLLGELNWFLMGYRTEWALIIILLEVGLLAWFISDLSGKRAFQIQELSVTANNSSARNQISSKKSRTVRGLNGISLRHIVTPITQLWMKQKFLQSPRFFQRVMSPHCYTVWSVAILVPVLIVSITALLILISQTPDHWKRYKEYQMPLFLFLGSIYGAIAAYINSVLHWEKRRKGMELEFCSPANRVDLAKQLWYGTGIDLVPLFFSLVIGLIVITPIPDRLPLSFILAFVTGTSLVFLFHGAQISLLAFRSNVPWACVTALAIALTILSCTLFRFSNELGFTGRIFAACGVLMTSILFNVWSYKKLTDREWGDLAE
ncbi:MAG TPA: hypothetical protein VNQ76_08100 [Planctomicrobium sp.]|nr:hypothetical protein [Planctomicrobium sp.]